MIPQYHLHKCNTYDNMVLPLQHLLYCYFIDSLMILFEDKSIFRDKIFSCEKARNNSLRRLKLCCRVNVRISRPDI